MCSFTLSNLLVLDERYKGLIPCNDGICNRKYKPSLDDVGSYLILYWVPTRYDEKIGDPLMAISDDPVMAGWPLMCSQILLDIFVCLVTALSSLLLP